MTSKQRITMMADWWPQACESQGWRQTDRELRLRVLSLAVSFAFTCQQEFRAALVDYDLLRVSPGKASFRDLKSANELNVTTDVDAVKRVLLMMGDNIKGAEEVARPEHGQSRRYRDLLRDQRKCLAIYPLDKPMGSSGAEAFIQAILNDKFNHGRRHENMTLEDVDDAPRFAPNSGGEMVEKPSQIEQLVMTVAQRLNGKNGFRATAGHSMHEMLASAGLPCACKACCIARARVPRPFFVPALEQPVAVLEIEPENCPF